MKVKEQREYVFPVWAVEALECGDFDGLNETEKEQFSEWMKREGITERFDRVSFEFGKLIGLCSDPAFGCDCICVELTVIELEEETAPTFVCPECGGNDLTVRRVEHRYYDAFLSQVPETGRFEIAKGFERIGDEKNGAVCGATEYFCADCHTQIALDLMSECVVVGG